MFVAMKYFAVIILSLSLSFRPLVYLAEYWLNYDYITKELCINRFDVSKKCLGSCYLENKFADYFGTTHQEKGFGKTTSNFLLSDFIVTYPIDKNCLSHFDFLSNVFPYFNYYTLEKVKFHFRPPIHF